LENLRRLYGDPTKPPRASIIIPVNAQKDLSRILLVASDIASYKGHQPLEFILVVNNYPPEQPPKEIDEYIRLGFRVLGIPKVVHHGDVVMAARILGIELARSESILLFDADCRIPNADSLLSWYMTQLESGIALAYTHVDYFDLPAGMATKVRMFIHHASRWFRRVILGIPTCRGSNYAIKRQLILDLYSQGRISYDIHVGPVLKSIGGKIAYSGARELVVLTSGRFFTGGWKELITYLAWRVGFYRRVFAARSKKSSSDK
jgi:hypothetical protein